MSWILRALVAGIPVSEGEGFEERESLGRDGEDFAGVEEKRPITPRQVQLGKDQDPPLQPSQNSPAQNQPTNQEKSTSDQG